MALGFLETILLVGIVAVLFGPQILRFVQRYQTRHQTRNQRLKTVAERRRAEAAAAKAVRDAKIKIIVCSVAGAILLFTGLYLALWPVQQVNSYQVDTQVLSVPPQYKQMDAVAQDGMVSIEGYRNVTQLRHENDWFYAAVEGGKIIRVRENGTGLTELVSTGGEIISFDLDADGNIIFTDALYDKKGGALLKASFDGLAVTVEPLLTEVAGTRLLYPTGVEVADDGTIYFLNATEHAVKKAGSTAGTLRNAQVAHAQDGTLYAYDPDAGSCERMVSGLSFAASLALSSAQDVIYVSQFTDASIYAVTVQTRDATLGTQGVAPFAEGLSSYPAGLSVGTDGTVTVALMQRQFVWFEALSELPAWREVLLRLPQGTRDALLSYQGDGQIAQFAADGTALALYQTKKANSPTGITSAIVVEDAIYLAQANAKRNEWIGTFVP